MDSVGFGFDFGFGFDLQVEPADCWRRSPWFFFDFGDFRDCKYQEMNNSGGRGKISVRPLAFIVDVRFVFAKVAFVILVEIDRAPKM